MTMGSTMEALGGTSRSAHTAPALDESRLTAPRRVTTPTTPMLVAARNPNARHRAGSTLNAPSPFAPPPPPPLLPPPRAMLSAAYDSSTDDLRNGTVAAGHGIPSGILKSSLVAPSATPHSGGSARGPRDTLAARDRDTPRDGCQLSAHSDMHSHADSFPELTQLMDSTRRLRACMENFKFGSSSESASGTFVGTDGAPYPRAVTTGEDGFGRDSDVAALMRTMDRMMDKKDSSVTKRVDFASDAAAQHRGSLRPQDAERWGTQWSELDQKVAFILEFYDRDDDGFWTYDDARNCQLDTDDSELSFEDWSQLCEDIGAVTSEGVCFYDLKKMYTNPAFGCDIDVDFRVVKARWEARMLPHLQSLRYIEHVQQTSTPAARQSTPPDADASLLPSFAGSRSAALLTVDDAADSPPTPLSGSTQATRARPRKRKSDGEAIGARVQFDDVPDVGNIGVLPLRSRSSRRNRSATSPPCQGSSRGGFGILVESPSMRTRRELAETVEAHIAGPARAAPPR